MEMKIAQHRVSLAEQHSEEELEKQLPTAVMWEAICEDTEEIVRKLKLIDALDKRVAKA